MPVRFGVPVDPWDDWLPLIDDVRCPRCGVLKGVCLDLRFWWQNYPRATVRPHIERIRAGRQR